MNGSVTCGERVVIVEVHSGRVHLKTGRISSADSGHVHADNRNTTVVWGDRQFQPVMESPDDAYERSFEVNDIHLLKEQEAYSLADLNTAQDWFGAIYQDRLVTKINRALKRLKEKQHQRTPTSRKSELNMSRSQN
jgi:ribosome-associated translation inhibitor RaiA